MTTIINIILSVLLIIVDILCIFVSRECKRYKRMYYEMRNWNIELIIENGKLQTLKGEQQ